MQRESSLNENNRNYSPSYLSIAWSSLGTLLETLSKLTNYFSTTRHLTAGALFWKRLLSPKLTNGQLIIPALFLGSFSAYSPFLQCRNSIEKVVIMLNQPGGILLFIRWSPLGGAAGFSFAEMTYTAVSALLPIIPVIEQLPSESVYIISTFLGSCALFANFLLYTEKLANLKLLKNSQDSKDIKNESLKIKFGKIIVTLKDNKLKHFSLSVNFILSCVAVITNYQFGKELCVRLFSSNKIIAIPFGIASATGPAMQCYADSELNAQTIIKTFEEHKSSRASISDTSIFTEEMKTPLLSSGDTTVNSSPSSTDSPVVTPVFSLPLNTSFSDDSKNISFVTSSSSPPSPENHVQIPIDNPKQAPILPKFEAEAKEHFTFRRVGRREVLLCFVFAWFSVFPNMELNITANLQGTEGLAKIIGIFLLIIGTIYNVGPKFISSVETKFKELQAELEEEKKYSFRLSDEGEEWVRRQQQSQHTSSEPTTLTP